MSNSPTGPTVGVHYRSRQPDRDRNDQLGGGFVVSLGRYELRRCRNLSFESSAETTRERPWGYFNTIAQKHSRWLFSVMFLFAVSCVSSSEQQVVRQSILFTNPSFAGGQVVQGQQLVVGYPFMVTSQHSVRIENVVTTGRLRAEWLVVHGTYRPLMSWLEPGDQGLLLCWLFSWAPTGSRVDELEITFSDKSTASLGVQLDIVQPEIISPPLDAGTLLLSSGEKLSLHGEDAMELGVSAAVLHRVPLDAETKPSFVPALTPEVVEVLEEVGRFLIVIAQGVSEHGW